MAENEVTIRIRADADPAVSELRKLQSGLGGTTAMSQSLGSSLVPVGLALGAVTLAVGGAVAAASSLISAFSESETATVRLDAVLKATGNQMGVTTNELLGFSSELQAATGIADESISNVQTTLLTFKDVAPESFKRATEAALDMSAVFGGDAQSAALQLGKALNDPIAGVSALSRMGIQFTESQKATIKTMVDTNDVLGAQRIILKEVESQVGGTARAMGDTAAGKAQRFSMAIGELQEKLGEALVNGLTPLADKMLAFATDPATIKGVENLAETLGTIVGVFGDIVIAIGKATSKLAGFIGAAAEASSQSASFDMRQGARGIGATIADSSASFIERAKAVVQFVGLAAGATQANANMELFAETLGGMGAIARNTAIDLGDMGGVTDQWRDATNKLIPAAREAKEEVVKLTAAETALAAFRRSLAEEQNLALAEAYRAGGLEQVAIVKASQADQTLIMETLAADLQRVLDVDYTEALKLAVKVLGTESDRAAASTKKAADALQEMGKNAVTLTQQLWAAMGGSTATKAGLVGVGKLLATAPSTGGAVSGANADALDKLLEEMNAATNRRDTSVPKSMGGGGPERPSVTVNVEAGIIASPDDVARTVADAINRASAVSGPMLVAGSVE